ncbi:hypothetical protein YC2023_019555 [Brassica napus]
MYLLGPVISFAKFPPRDSSQTHLTFKHTKKTRAARLVTCDFSFLKQANQASALSPEEI